MGDLLNIQTLPLTSTADPVLTAIEPEVMMLEPEVNDSQIGFAQVLHIFLQLVAED